MGGDEGVSVTSAVATLTSNGTSASCDGERLRVVYADENPDGGPQVYLVPGGRIRHPMLGAIARKARIDLREFFVTDGPPH